MEFINECGCVFDYVVLKNAIIDECRRRGIKAKKSYKIYNFRGYAGISLKHEKVSVHRIIGKYMIGFDFGSELHVHHLDGNKFNNQLSNLQVLRNSLHVKEHNISQYVSEEYKRGFGNRVKDIISRKDVTEENVRDLREKGYTIPKIAEELNCGYNTVCRRLGMKDY